MNQKDKTNLKFNNVWVCDFETIVAETEYFKKHNKTGITYGYMAHMDNPNFNYQFNDIGMMMYFLNNCTNGTQYIYFHNLSFDGVFILDYLMKNGYRVTDRLKKSKDVTIFRSTGRKIYKIEVLKKFFQGIHIKYVFLCSKLILNASVEELGKSVGISKYDVNQKDDPNFHIREPQEDVDLFYEKNVMYCEYCKRDVNIIIKTLREVFTAIYEFLKTHGLEDKMNLIYKSSTASSMSLNMQKILMEKNGISTDGIFLKNFQDRVDMDLFTNGGLTVNNTNYQQTNLKNLKGYIIDLKSAYPSIMKEKLPYGNPISDTDIDKVDDYCEFLEIHYDHIWADNHKIPMLKNWNRNRKINESLYFLQARDYTTYLLREEAEAIESLYKFEGKTIKRSIKYELKSYMSEFIDEMFKYKELYKKENQPAKSHTFKILMNSGYGVHAKRYNFKSVSVDLGKKFYEFESGKIYVVNSRKDLNNPTYHTYIPNTKLVALDPYNFQDWDIFAHKAIANYITARTRIKLIEGIKYFGPDHFAYCDTDSLFLVNVDIKKIKQYCGSNLGDWELESKEFDEADFVRPKLYEVKKDGKVIKKGSAGVRADNKMDISRLTIERRFYCEAANLLPFRVDGGIILLPTAKFIDIGDSLNVKGLYHIDQDDIKPTKELIEWFKERGWYSDKVPNKGKE